MKNVFFILLLFTTIVSKSQNKASSTTHSDIPQGLGFYINNSNILEMDRKTISMSEIKLNRLSMGWDASVPKNEKMQILSFTVIFTAGTKSYTYTISGDKFSDEVENAIQTMDPKGTKCTVQFKNIRYKKENGKTASVLKSNVIQIVL